MRIFSYYIKHSFSCLSDQTFDVQVDDESKTVTISTQTFDSSLISHILRSVLPDEGVVAFVDDNTREPYGSSPPFALQIRIGEEGPIFNARAVLLCSAVRTGIDLAIAMSLARNTKEIDQ